MHKYFNPGTVQKFIDRTLPFFSILTLVFGASGLYFALYASPADYQQGEAVRIMFMFLQPGWHLAYIYLYQQ